MSLPYPYYWTSDAILAAANAVTFRGIAVLADAGNDQPVARDVEAMLFGHLIPQLE
jgi:hypothetical protein